MPQSKRLDASRPARREAAVATVVPFPGPRPDRFRRAAASDPSGTILLFTGVRYERTAESGAGEPLRRWS